VWPGTCDSLTTQFLFIDVYSIYMTPALRHLLGGDGRRHTIPELAQRWDDFCRAIVRDRPLLGQTRSDAPRVYLVSSHPPEPVPEKSTTALVQTIHDGTHQFADGSLPECLLRRAYAFSTRRCTAREIDRIRDTTSADAETRPYMLDELVGDPAALHALVERIAHAQVTSLWRDSPIHLARDHTEMLFGCPQFAEIPWVYALAAQTPFMSESNGNRRTLVATVLTTDAGIVPVTGVHRLRPVSVLALLLRNVFHVVPLGSDATALARAVWDTKGAAPEELEARLREVAEQLAQRAVDRISTALENVSMPAIAAHEADTGDGRQSRAPKTTGALRTLAASVLSTITGGTDPAQAFAFATRTPQDIAQTIDAVRLLALRSGPLEALHDRLLSMDVGRWVYSRDHVGVSPHAVVPTGMTGTKGWTLDRVLLAFAVLVPWSGNPREVLRIIYNEMDRVLAEKAITDRSAAKLTSDMRLTMWSRVIDHVSKWAEVPGSPTVVEQLYRRDAMWWAARVVHPAGFVQNSMPIFRLLHKIATNTEGVPVDEPNPYPPTYWAVATSTMPFASLVPIPASPEVPLAQTYDALDWLDRENDLGYSGN